MAYKRPIYYFWVPEDQREARCHGDDDVYIIKADPENPDDQDVYAIRCTLDIPIKGVKEPFCWGLWVTQSKESFERYVQTFKQDQSEDGSFGWLAVDMPHYCRNGPNEPVESLGCDIQWGRKGKRPKIVIRACDHPLYLDQAQGIDWDRAMEIAQSQMRVIHGAS